MPTDLSTIDKDKHIVEESEKKKKRSFGNKAFDWIVWPAILWIGVWGVSLYLANKAQNGTGTLNKWFKSGQDWFAPKLAKFADSRVAQKLWGSSKESWAGGLFLTGVLSMGGTLLLPVIKFFEDRRQQIAAWFDKTFHKIPEDPELIKAEPKQTWGSMIKSRLLVIAAGFVVFGAIGPRRAGAVQNKVGGWATDGFMKVAKNADRDKVNKWANLAVFDLFLTAIGTMLHYIMSRVIAASKTEKAKIELANAVLVEGEAAENKAAPAKSAEQKNGLSTEDTKSQIVSGDKKTPQSWMSGVDVTPMDITSKEASYTLH